MVAQLRLEASQEEQMPENQQAVLEYEAAGASDQGRTRKSNEDAYGLSLRNSEGACNFVVCDGMGGAAAGEVASRLAVDAMLRAMDDGVLTLETFQHAVDAANHSVHRQRGPGSIPGRHGNDAGGHGYPRQSRLGSPRGGQPLLSSSGRQAGAPDA